MSQLSVKTQSTYHKLNRKAQDFDSRMPAIAAIEAALTEIGIKFTAYNTRNIVEHKSKGNVFVNSRHEGKAGRKIEIRDQEKGIYFSMDTSESYYSINTWGYAQALVSIIDKHI